MRQRVFCALYLVISIMLITGFLGCSTVGTDKSADPISAGLERKTQQVTIDKIGGSCVKLFAGQTIDAGTVCFEDIDTNEDGWADTLRVTYATKDGWELVETHFWLGTRLADMPMTNKGNPIPGQFPYGSGDITGQTEYYFDIPFSAFGMECPGPEYFFVAAHAAIRKPNGTGGYLTETGWGEGQRIVTKGNWATWFAIWITCTNEEPPSPPGCETAFAYGGDYATCFLDLDLDNDGQGDFNRWGWTNGPLAACNYEFEIWAAAGQCDLTKGTHVGTLYVDYDGATATVTYDMHYSFYMDETHLYVGNEILPRKNGEYTVAPGQFGHIHDLDGATYDQFVIDGLSGDIYVVAHAVVCHEDIYFKDPPLPSPDAHVGMTVTGSVDVYPITTTLSNVPVAPPEEEPYVVYNGAWTGWCADKLNYVYLGIYYSEVHLLSSYDMASWPADALADPRLDLEWDKINYIINHKQGTGNEVQDALWYFTNGITPPTATGQAMVDDANANGDGWFPTEGQNMALICYHPYRSTYPAGVVQLTFIEVDP